MLATETRKAGAAVMAALAALVLALFATSLLVGPAALGLGDSLAALLAGRGEEDQREAPAFIVITPRFFQPEQAIEGDGFLKVQNPDHRVQICDPHWTLPLCAATIDDGRALFHHKI